MLLNDTQHLKPLHTITVKNTGKKAVTVSISHTAAGTVNTFESATSFVHPYVLLRSPNSLRLVLILFIPKCLARCS